jgi:hypothetical protein
VIFLSRMQNPGYILRDRGSKFPANGTPHCTVGSVLRRFGVTFELSFSITKELYISFYGRTGIYRINGGS